MNHVSELRAASGGAAPRPRARSVIYIFLSGGLSQIDSFDMKPDAPREIRGEFDPIPTRTPGLQICEHLPMLAKRSDRWGLCRSLTHPCNEHSEGHLIMLSGRTDCRRGSTLAVRTTATGHRWQRSRPTCSARAELPPAIVLPEKLVHRTGRVIPGQFAGQMGERNNPFFVGCAKYNPTSYGAFPDYEFHHREGEKHQGLEFQAPNLTLPQGLSLDRMHGRLGLVAHLDAQQAHLEATGEAEEWAPLPRDGGVAAVRPRDQTRLRRQRRRPAGARPLRPQLVRQIAADGAATRRGRGQPGAGQPRQQRDLGQP